MTAIKILFNDLAKVYFVIASIFLATFVFLNPPFQLPDETHQFFRAYQIAELNLIAEVSENKFGGYLPSSIKKLTDEMITAPQGLIVFDNNLLFEPQKIFNSLSLPLETSINEFVEFPTQASKPFVPYLISALGIFLGKNLSLSPLIIFWLGRVFSAIFFLLAGYFILKNTSKNLRPIFFVSLLLPTTLYLASGITADTYTNIIAFGFIALILKFRTLESDFKKNQYLLLIVSLVLLAFAKPTYATLALMLLLIPKLKLKFKFIGISLTALVVLFLMIIGDKVTVPPRTDIQIDPKIQLQYIIDNPYTFLNNVADYFILNFGLFAKQCLAVLGWTQTFLSPIFYYILTAVLLFSPFCIPPTKKYNFNLFEIFLIIFIVFFSVFMVALMQFLTWVGAGETYIAGFQGRYMIPFLPLILVLIQDLFSFKYKIPNSIIIIGIFIGLLFSVNTLIHRFYI